MNLLALPLFTELKAAQRVLIAGAGGGFDVFSGLPLYFALEAAGKEVYLANLSFTILGAATGERLHPALLKVDADSMSSQPYFPEFHLSYWFRKHGKEVPIYCFERVGAKPLTEAYRILVDRLQVDAVVLVDGGTDSLMRGDEAGLGTPVEDMASIAAADELGMEQSYLVCLGFGVDAYHGVCHAHAFEAIADLTKQGAFLGAFTLLQEMPAVQHYIAASEWVAAHMPLHPSIVSTSIISAIEGHYGDYHRNYRTQGSTLWINPLMTLYWCFRLGPVARRIPYLDEVKTTDAAWEIMTAIDRYRASLGDAIRPRSSIPDASFKQDAKW